MFKKFAKFLAGKTEQERFMEYMSQATSLVHVEWLERKWFSEDRYK